MEGGQGLRTPEGVKRMENRAEADLRPALHLTRSWPGILPANADELSSWTRVWLFFHGRKYSSINTFRPIRFLSDVSWIVSGY